MNWDPQTGFDGLRTSFAKSPNAEKWREHIASVVQLASGEPADDEERLFLVRCLGLASHYAYLQRDTRHAFALFDQARSISAEAKRRPTETRMAAAYLVAKCRLYRNLLHHDDTDSFDIAARQLEQLLPELEDQLPPDSGELFDARLELAHVRRYEGEWRAVQTKYELLAQSTPIDDKYRNLLVLHFASSLACDFVELSVIPIERGGLVGRGTPQLRTDFLRARVPTGLQDRLCEAVKELPDSHDTAEYPFLNALFRKHEALWLAWSGDASDAAVLIRQARKTFEGFRWNGVRGRPKGLLLCDEFSALIELCLGDVDSALTMLESVRRSATAYYPRLVERVDTHLLTLHLLLGDEVDRSALGAAVRNALDASKRKWIRAVAFDGDAREDSASWQVSRIFVESLSRWIIGLFHTFAARQVVLATSGAGSESHRILASETSIAQQAVRPTNAISAAAAGTSPASHAGQRLGAKLDRRTEVSPEIGREALRMTLALGVLTGKPCPQVRELPGLVTKRIWFPLTLLGLVAATSLIFGRAETSPFTVALTFVAAGILWTGWLARSAWWVGRAKRLARTIRRS